MTAIGWRGDGLRRPSAAAAPRLDPVAFFAGRTHGEGELELRFDDRRRTISVEGVGTVEAEGVLRLHQTITFGSGRVESRDWVMRRRGADDFSATLSDARGRVRARAAGNLLHLRYLMRHPAVYMEQWLYLQPDRRTLLNLARVTVLGVEWARLRETIERVG